MLVKDQVIQTNMGYGVPAANAFEEIQDFVES
jgi:hypothetical protein